MSTHDMRYLPYLRPGSPLKRLLEIALELKAEVAETGGRRRGGRAARGVPERMRDMAKATFIRWGEVMDLGKAVEVPQLFGAAMHENPYPVYRRLRETNPEYWDDSLHAWVLTRYDDVSWSLKSLSSDRVSLARDRFQGAGVDALWDVLAVLMLQRDEPDHSRLRALVQKAFSRTSVEQWKDSIERRIRALLAPGLQRGHMDFIWDFAVPLPILVISELVGIPDDDRERVKRWCDDFSIVALNFYANIESDQLQRGLHSVIEFRTYLKAKVDELRRAPRQDLLSALVLAEHDGDRLTLDELLANTILLLNAGNETTSNLLGNGLVALLGHPDQVGRLRDAPASIADAVEECLRYDSPVQFQGRVAREEVNRAGAAIRRGDLVLAVLGAANRDPDHFQDPDCFDAFRHPNFHLAFGHGRHHCVGAELARLEARIAFTVLFTELKTLEFLPTELRHRENFNMRCYQNLPIRLSA
jgi:cytochrome P450